MRKLRNLSFAMLGTIALLHSSCSDEIESSSLVLNDFQTAEVKIHVYAPLDVRTENLQAAPAGTKVLVSTPYSSFNSQADGVFTDTLTVNSEGIIEADLKVGSSATTYTFQPLDFEAEQTQVDGAEPGVVQKMYTANSFSVSLLAGESYLNECTYAASAYSNENNAYTQMIEIDLYINGDFDDVTNLFRDVIPSGDDPVIIRSLSESDDWAVEFTGYETVTISENEDGSNPDYESTYSAVYSLSVPVGITLEVAPFLRDYTMSSGEVETYEYYKLSLGSFSKSDDGKGFKVNLSKVETSIEVIP